MLEIRGLSVSYNGIPALRRVSLDVNQGETVSVLGPNGAGKTTLLNAISGLVSSDSGSSIKFMGKELAGRNPDEVVAAGIVQVPEGRQIFAELTVLENIEMGTVLRRDRKQASADIAEMFDIFPELKGRERQNGGTLSGGEQQMLAIARALVAAPKLVMIDEPSMGLAPVVVQRIFRLIKDVIVKRGITVLLVEQNTALSFAVSDRAYILTQGSVAMHGTVAELSRDQRVKETYFRGRGDK
ncbi:MAG: High-affinity branched-chain amino acid transport ATP-binding protein LivF [Firmicutes bacterium ADurb.Bin506]|jgi:branched-chain amino acid transport system ATP-binding protein|nr:MAG: High-affinity branched-chain amino acid transport ATP-binding protein LivF [Firmicutes bacterium ADurb.Bin506]